jgi:hypothetical protein
MKKPKLKKPKKDQTDKFLPVHCHQGVCLVYNKPIIDRNGDQVSDADTIAMGLHPKDASVQITGPQIIAALGAGRLDSFNRGESAVIILPETFPNGERLFSKAIASLRSNYLSGSGISREMLAANELSTSSGFFLTVDKLSEKASSKGQLPDVRVGSVLMGEINDTSAKDLARVLYKARGGDKGGDSAPVIGGATPDGKRMNDPSSRGNDGDPKPTPPPKDGGARTFDGEYGPGAISLSAQELDRVLFKVRGGEVSGDSADGGVPNNSGTPNRRPMGTTGGTTSGGKRQNSPNSWEQMGDMPPTQQPPKEPKDGGSFTTGESDGGLIKLTPREVSVIAAIRGGDPVRDTSTGNADNGSIVGAAPGRWIVLVDPDQGEQPIDERFSMLVSPPKFVDKSPKSTNLGATIVEGIVPGRPPFP